MSHSHCAVTHGSVVVGNESIQVGGEERQTSNGQTDATRDKGQVSSSAVDVKDRQMRLSRHFRQIRRGDAADSINTDPLRPVLAGAAHL